MKYSSKPLLLIAVLLTCTIAFNSQGPCKPPEIVFSLNVANIFTEEQDMFLGDALAETIDKELLVISDDQAAAYLREIGERIARHLPANSIKFRFFVVDSPELNAMSVAGGRIYVTRKLIVFVRSEDELAGIIGHEMGHAVVRHHSSDLSKVFKEVLSVEGFRDRDDVLKRVHELIDRSRTRRVRQKSNHEDNQQLEADRIGLFAMTAAGYDPEANVTAWQRLNEIKPGDDGRRGLFGGSRPGHKRLREMLDSIKALPVDCRERPSIARAEGFRAWQSHVVSIAKIRHVESLPGLLTRGRLQPYLRGSIVHLQFSPDGQYVVAQDATGINILRRDPLSFAFRINVADAKLAHFSPDSKRIIVQTYGLRVESWDLETRRRVSVHEVYVRDRCLQTALSPDGKMLVCYAINGDLHLLEVETSDKIFSKKEFHTPGTLQAMIAISALERRFRETDTMEMEFSPDGKYFLGAAVFRSTFIGTFPGGRQAILSALGLDEKSFIAYDLLDRKEIKVPDAIKNIVSMPFAFYSKDKIVGQHASDNDKSGIFTFPGGERVEKFFLAGQSYDKTTSGDYLIVRPTKSDPAGVYSVPLRKFVLLSKSAAVDGYGDFFVVEGLNGSVELMKMSGGEELEKVGAASLPKNDLGDIRAIAVSDNLDRIALSEKSRGAAWDLKTGMRKVYIRGFRGAYIDPTGAVYADFPASENELRSVAVLDTNAGTAKALRNIDHVSALQAGRFIVDVVPADSKETTHMDEALLRRQRAVVTMGMIGVRLPDMRIDVSDVSSGKLLWSKKLGSGVPGYSVSQDGKTITLRWSLSGKAAKEIIRNSPGLADEARRMGEKDGDYLFQVLDAETGNSVGDLLVETGEGSFRITGAFATGDFLTLVDSENRVLFYSIRTGELKARVFGEAAAVNPSLSIAAVQNFPGVLSIEDLNTGTHVGELKFSGPIAFAKFSGDGSRLFVLTTSQDYYTFDASRIAQR